MNFVFLSCTENYPVAFSANNTKIEYISRGLMELGHETSIIGRINGKKGYTSDVCMLSPFGAKCILFHQGNNKIVTVLRNIRSQLSLLRKLKNMNSDNILVLDTGYVLTFLLYVIFGKCIGYNILHIITEWPNLSERRFLNRWNDRIYLTIFGRFCDGLLPISDMLASHIVHFGKPILKVPILAEYNQFTIENDKLSIFTYCANAGYFRIISFVLDAVSIVKIKEPDIVLKMVLYGTEDKIEKVKQYIKKLGLENNVIIRQRVSQAELLEIYQKSIGLLIPLDPASIQDQNRFSQKIAEYLSSGTPIITSPVGEVVFYFTDKKNAIFASDFTPEAYAECMLWLLKNRKIGQVIGNEGYILGNMNFNYGTKAKQIVEFLQNEII